MNYKVFFVILLMEYKNFLNILYKMSIFLMTSFDKHTDNIIDDFAQN